MKRWQSDAARSKDYSRGGRMSHPSDFKVPFASFDMWDGALSCNKITFPRLLAHSGRFSINPWFKLIILDDSVVELGHHPVTPAIPHLRTFVFHIEIATFKLLKPCLACSNGWSVFTITILPANDDFPQPFTTETLMFGRLNFFVFVG